MQSEERVINPAATSVYEWLDRILLLKAILSCSLILILGAIGIRILVTWPDFRSMSNNLSLASAEMYKSSKSLNTALNGKHGNGDDGILFLTQLAVRHMDSAASAIRQTSIEGRNLVPEQNAALLDVLHRGAETVTALNGVLKTADGTVGDIRTKTLPELTSAIQSLNTKAITPAAEFWANTNRTIQHVDGLLSSPDIARSIVNTANFTASLDQTFSSLNVSLYGPSLDSKAEGTFFHVNSSLANIDRGTGYVADKFKPTKRGFWMAIPANAGSVLLALRRLGVI